MDRLGSVRAHKPALRKSAAPTSGASCTLRGASRAACIPQDPRLVSRTCHGRRHLRAVIADGRNDCSPCTAPYAGLWAVPVGCGPHVRARAATVQWPFHDGSARALPEWACTLQTQHSGGVRPTGCWSRPLLALRTSDQGQLGSLAALRDHCQHGEPSPAWMPFTVTLKSRHFH